MRLINSKSLHMEEFLEQYNMPSDDGIPPYAILSHTWGKEEVTFQDMQWSEAQNKAGFSKVLNCCEQAKRDGLEWVWIDTCCIDKTSSTELSEAINSMFEWYRYSAVCYALLEDVPPLNPFSPEDEFQHARWFNRGWCLQELIAPSKVEFYAADWTELGTKWSLHHQIEATTGIPSDILLNKTDLASYTIAQRFSWTSRRETTRQEDQAYCLLAIFGISMPLLYGEGQHAFIRLQEEILRQTEDYSLLLWTDGPDGYHVNDGDDDASIAPRLSYRSVLTPFPNDFRKDGKPPFQNSASLLLWTGCKYRNKYMCIMLSPDRDLGGILRYGRSRSYRIWLMKEKDFQSFFELSELYLTTALHYSRRESVHAERHCQGRVLDIEIIMSTKCEDTVSFIAVCPPTQLETCSSQAQVQAAQRLYCYSVMSSENPLLLKFKASESVLELLAARTPLFARNAVSGEG